MNAIAIAAVVGLLTFDTLPQNATAAPQGFTHAQARHLLMRAGFGGNPKQIEALRSKGRQGAVAHLIRFEQVQTKLTGHGTVPTERPARETYRKLDEDGKRMLRRKLRREDARKINQLRSWWLERMLTSPRPFEEKMTLFWHGHFTSGYRDVRNAYQLAVQNDLFRSHACGNFSELVYAIAKDPAMLEYLDNNRNNKRAPNENFARELMELFTLGEGEYTEEDIKAAARAFTGWTFDRRNASFRFIERNHDSGSKTFLGHTKNFDGNGIIKRILEQDAAPRHLARQLLTYFAVAPTESEIEPFADILRNNGYELEPFFMRLFTSDWFYSPRVMGKQIKSPIVLTVSTLRMLDRTRVPESARIALSGGCRNIGQELFQPPNVKGWDGGAAWVTSSNLLSRYNLTRALITGSANTSQSRRQRPQGKRRQQRGSRALRRIGSSSLHLLSVVRSADLKDHDAVLNWLEERFLVTPLSTDRREALLDFMAGKDGSRALDMSDRSPSWAIKMQELLHLLTATPEFQIS